MQVYDQLLHKAVNSLAAAFRKRVATGLQTSRGFVKLDQHEARRIEGMT